MNSRIPFLIQLMLLVILPPAIGSALSQDAPTYHLENLGTPLGGTFAAATGITPLGLLGSGYADLTGDTSQHAVLWFLASHKDLGTFGGANSALLKDLSGFSEKAETDRLGQDFCATGTHHVCVPITVERDLAVALPLLGGPNGAAFGDNGVGEVAGTAQTEEHDPSCLVDGQPVEPFFQVLRAVPVLWKDGKVSRLPLPSGDSDGNAAAINHFGGAVGSTGDCEANPSAHAVLWRDRKMTDLGNLGGRMNNIPLGINDRGQVTGFSDLPGDQTSHAFLWQDGEMRDLGTLPGDDSSYGSSINNLGQIVGYSCDINFDCRAFLWEKGKMIDLNTLIPASSPLFLVQAVSINDFGWIVGFGFDQSANTLPAFVLLPRPAGQEASSSAVHSDAAAPRVSMPANLRALMEQKTKWKGVPRIAQP
jgi:probable HAF family extracellular repeat protein